MVIHTVTLTHFSLAGTANEPMGAVYVDESGHPRAIYFNEQSDYWYNDATEKSGDIYDLIQLLKRRYKSGEQSIKDIQVDINDNKEIVRWRYLYGIRFTEEQKQANKVILDKNELYGVF